jgi:hypothetical protein
MRRAGIIAWSLFALALLAALATLIIAVASEVLSFSFPEDREPSGGVAGLVLIVVVVAALGPIGAVVASNRPRNPIGWFLCASPPLLAAMALGEGLYWLAVIEDSAAVATAELGLWLNNWLWVPMVVFLFVFLPLLFPTGRPPTPRWRIVGWMGLGAGLAMAIGTAFQPGPLDSFRWVENPLGVEAMPAAVPSLGFALWVVSSIAAVASLVVRFRRSQGVERQQIKWVVAAAIQLLLTFVAGGVLDSALSEDAGFAFLTLGFMGVALAVALAILRYRLYDIDVVVNRALVYGALTATLAGAYIGLVLLLQLALSPGSDLAIAGSTLAVAALFRPARVRIQSAVDRRFYRRKYDAQRTLETFSARVRDEVELASLTAELRSVVVDTVQPAHVSVWLRGGAAR